MIRHRVLALAVIFTAVLAAGLPAKKEIRGRPPDERQQVRTTRARPLLQSLQEWFEVSLNKLSRKFGYNGGHSLRTWTVDGTDTVLR